MNKSILAILKIEIVLPTDDSKIVPKSSLISVDTSKMIAYWEGYHFEIFQDEYQIMN